MRILLVHLGANDDDDLVAAVREFGHDVRVVTKPQDVGEPWTEHRPDVIVVRLEADSARCLDVLEALASKRHLVGAPILVTGGNELAITAARRRFPDASFARLDALQTALASIEAGE